MIKAIIFDVDGVLIESAELKTKAFAKLFADYPDQLPEFITYHQINAGISRFVKFHYFYEKLLGQELTAQKEAELGDRFSRIVLEEILQAPLTPGVIEFLSRNKDRYLFFIASGTPQEELIDIINHRQLSRFFREIHGSPRQKDEIVTDILDRHSLQKEEVVYIGDAASDRNAAEKTGITFIARINSENHELQNCRWTVNDLTELDTIIDNVVSY